MQASPIAAQSNAVVCPFEQSRSRLPSQVAIPSREQAAGALPPFRHAAARAQSEPAAARHATVAASTWLEYWMSRRSIPLNALTHDATDEPKLPTAPSCAR